MLNIFIHKSLKYNILKKFDDLLHFMLLHLHNLYFDCLLTPSLGVGIITVGSQTNCTLRGNPTFSDFFTFLYSRLNCDFKLWIFFSISGSDTPLRIWLQVRTWHLAFYFCFCNPGMQHPKNTTLLESLQLILTWFPRRTWCTRERKTKRCVLLVFLRTRTEYVLTT